MVPDPAAEDLTSSALPCQGFVNYSYDVRRCCVLFTASCSAGVCCLCVCLSVCQAAGGPYRARTCHYDRQCKCSSGLRPPTRVMLENHEVVAFSSVVMTQFFLSAAAVLLSLLSSSSSPSAAATRGPRRSLWSQPDVPHSQGQRYDLEIQMIRLLPLDPSLWVYGAGGVVDR